MHLSKNVIILIIVVTFVLSIIFIIILAFQIQKWNNENIRRIRRRRVLPINRLIRLHQLRSQLYQVELDKHYEKRQQVIEQLKKQ